MPPRLQFTFLGSRLARRLFALFVLISLVPLSVSDWVSNTAVKEIAETLNLNSRASNTRQTSRQVLDRLIACKAILVTTAASTPSMVDLFRAGSLPGLGTIFLNIAQLQVDGRVAWSYDATGRSHAGAWRDATLAQVTQFLQPKANGGSIDVRLRVLARSANPPHLVLSVQHRGGSIWIAELNPEYIWAPVLQGSEDTQWKVLDTEGHTLIERAGDDFSAQLQKLTVPMSNDEFVETRSPLFLAGEFDGGDWNFVQTAPRPKVLWKGESLTLWLSLVALGTILMIAYLSHWLIRRTLAPLELLTLGTQKLAAGDTRTRVKIESDDELGTLATGFNEMATRIEAQFDAMKGLAGIDQDILAGVSIERLAERVLSQLEKLYPRSRSALFWLSDETQLTQTTLLSGESGSQSERATQTISLSTEQAMAFGQIVSDEQLSANNTRGLIRELSAPWLDAVCTPAARTLTLLPIRQQGQTQSMIAIGLPENPDTPEFLQPARELRDRLTVALAARAREQELVYRAVHDSLTGLTNRYGLHIQLEKLLDTSSPTARAAVLFLDLDHFKDVNDSRGHEAGDELLRLASARLLACVPGDAIVARQGGDEFAIVLPNAGADEAGAIAAKAVDELGRPFKLHDGEHIVGASIGIALSPQNGLDRQELLRCADIALYAAKSAGRGQYLFFNSTLDQAALERVQLLAELRSAVERSDFRLYYQPRVAVTDGAVKSVEALLRWQHPTRGLISPIFFIALAESSGLIDEIGEWVLNTACAQFMTWQNTGVQLERIAINVSPRQLESGDLPHKIKAALVRHALPPASLEIEITESLLVGETTAIHQQLSEIRSWGVTIALDDFGTGYSSMSTLRQLPIDVMKIDQSFVRELATDDSAKAVVNAIVSLARSLHLSLVAEGVENESQANFLRSLGCDELQGYLYGKPVAPEELIKVPGLKYSPKRL